MDYNIEGAPRGRPVNDIATNDEYCGHNNNYDQPGTGINNEFGEPRGEQSATGEKPEINRPNKYGEPDGQYPETGLIGQPNGMPGTHIGAHVETHGRASLQKQPSPPPFIRKPKSISSFIGGFKSAINSKIDDYIDKHHLEISKYNRDNHFFQPNYCDHIIRDEQSCQNISEYIINNPAKWDDDKFNPSNKTD